MTDDSKGSGPDGDEQLGDALRIFLEHRSSGAGESDAELVRRHPRLRELLEPLLAQDSPIAGQLRADVQLGEFRLIECIGRGGMGEVWEAEQLSLRRRVALKVLRAQSFASAHHIERFRREALAGARLKHPCIVAVYAVGDAEGIHYIAQELVESRRTLAMLLRECRERSSILPEYWRETAERFVRIAEALELAHGTGVIHRDLKPSNILIASDGTPKIADFGLALVAGEGELSRTGDMSGSPFYMSPEQASGARGAIEQRSDVFSLGATLYEALTLQRPFDGDTLGQVLAKIMLVDPRDPREIRSLCPSDLAVICMKMLEKSPQRRYGCMRDVADELGRFLRSEPIRAKPAGAAARAIKWSRRHPAIAASSAIVCASLIVVSALLFETARARAGAEISTRKAMASAIAERTAAEQARVESRISSRITDFLVEAFLEASPTRTLGHETTAREVLDEGVRNIRAGLTEPAESGQRARLLGTFGMVYSRLGLRPQAEELLLEARELGEAAFGPLDTRTLDNKSELARLYAETGRLQLSLELAGEIFEARAAKDGAESRVALRDEANFAQLLMYMNRLEEAEGHLQHALLGLEKLGEDTTVTLYGLAQVQRHLGRTEAARATLQRCIDLSDARKGLDAPDSLSVRETLAEFLLISGDTEGAARLFRQVAGSRACVQGSLHPETLQSLARAVGAESSTDPDAALAELHRLWTLCTSQFGADDSTTLEVSNSLCMLLIEQRRDLEAEEQLAAMIDCEARRSLSSPTKYFGELCSLATIELRLARPELALSIYEEVIHAADGARHPNPESLNTAMFQVIDLCHELGCDGRALPSARRWLEIAAIDQPQRASVIATIERLESTEKGR